MEKPRCRWCHEYHDIMYEKVVDTVSRLGIPQGEDVEFFCSEACYESAVRHMQACRRATLPFTALLFLAVACIIYSGRLSDRLDVPLRVFLGSCLLPIGILLQFIPFTTPETAQYVGMQKGRWMMRMVGIFLIVFSIAFIL